MILTWWGLLYSVGCGVLVACGGVPITWVHDRIVTWPRVSAWTVALLVPASWLLVLVGLVRVGMWINGFPITHSS